MHQAYRLAEACKMSAPAATLAMAAGEGSIYTVYKEYTVRQTMHARTAEHDKQLSFKFSCQASVSRIEL